MIYDTASLRNLYQAYANIQQKIDSMVAKGNLTHIRRGLFTDDIHGDAQLMANICLFPSYLSLTHALRVYGLILEYVSAYTFASFGKKGNKTFVFSPEFSFHKGNCSVISFEYDFHFDSLY